MLRGSLLAAALLTLLAIGPQDSSAAFPGRDGLIAFYRVISDGKGPAEIYTMTPSGTHTRQLTRSMLSNFEPSFSADGKKIVFVRSGHDVRGDLWTMSVDGSHQRRLTSTVAIDEIDPVWSPNGKEIAFAVDHPAKLRGIWVIDSDGAHRRRIATGDTFQPMWSPDGKRIGFSRSYGTAASWIWAVPAGGGTARHLSFCPHSYDGYICGPSGSDWSPDGRRILFTDLAAGFSALFVATLGARNEGNVPGIHGDLIWFPGHPVWSPDGREIVYSGSSLNPIGHPPTYLYVLAKPGRHWQRRRIPNSRGANDPSWQPLP
ncbi:MAG TPA: hypothetical protein VKB43_14625 [Gaiellaceae bacterium]|nr:hypothetical protein [Gaiellaceae bacterium]